MRYRNRIKLAPGLTLNLSKSGVSATVGMKGASMNFNKLGTYANYGIPGTGFYNRKKISTKKTYENRKQVGIELNLDDDYNPVIRVYDEGGRNITNESLVSKVKRTDDYKKNIKDLYYRHYEMILDETLEYTELHKGIVNPIGKNFIIDLLNNLKQQEYSIKSFDKQIPSKETIKKELLLEGKQKYKSILFWKNKKNIQLFINENLESKFENALFAWEQQKIVFDKEEIEKKRLLDENYLNEFLAEKENLLGNLEGKEDIVLLNFQRMLSEIQIKPSFFVDFQYNENEKTFYLDIDLPEVEDIPKKTANILKSGKISVKEKSEKQIREDYANCVLGLGYLITSIAFMSSVAIENVIISAYTQRINEEVGKEQDDYIYSIKIDRVRFSSIDFSKIDMLLSFRQFTHIMSLSKSFVFDSIDINKNPLM